MCIFCPPLHPPFQIKKKENEEIPNCPRILKSYIYILVPDVPSLFSVENFKSRVYVRYVRRYSRIDTRVLPYLLKRDGLDNEYTYAIGSDNYSYVHYLLRYMKRLFHSHFTSRVYLLDDNDMDKEYRSVVNKKITEKIILWGIKLQGLSLNDRYSEIGHNIG